MKRLHDDDYVVAEGGVWLTVRNLSVRIREGDEGVSITVYPLGREDEDSIVETWALYSEAEDETAMNT